MKRKPSSLRKRRLSGSGRWRTRRSKSSYHHRHRLDTVHARFDELEGDFATDGLMLLGDEHQAHAAFADLFHELVRANNRPKTLRDRPVVVGSGTRSGRFLQETAGVLMGLQE